MKMNKMGLNEMVTYIEQAILDEKKDIVVNSEFGNIIVEVDYDTHGPETNVIIDGWAFAPSHARMTASIIGFKADYYVCICNPTSALSLHLKVVEAVYRIMFKHMLRVDITEDVVDAAIMIHRHDVENKPLRINALVNDFSRYSISMMVRNNDMVQWLIRDHFERRLAAAKHIIEAGCELFDKEYSTFWQNVIHLDDYNRKMFGLILYVCKKEGINLYSKIDGLYRPQTYVIK